MWTSFLLVMLAGLATAYIPCSLYDVTTLRRNDSSGYRYEIHSRSNAVGIQTNYESITGLIDPRENQSCRFRDKEACPGWQINGFHQYPLVNSVLDWNDVYQHQRRDIYDNVKTNQQDGKSSSRRTLAVERGYTVDDGRVLQFILEMKQPGQFLALGTQSTRRTFPMDGIEFSRDKNHGSQLQYQVKRYYLADDSDSSEERSSVEEEASMKFVTSARIKNPPFNQVIGGGMMGMYSGMMSPNPPMAMNSGMMSTMMARPRPHGMGNFHSERAPMTVMTPIMKRHDPAESVHTTVEAEEKPQSEEMGLLWTTVEAEEKPQSEEMGLLSGAGNGVVRVFVRKERGLICIWAENADSSDDCLYMNTSHRDSISVITPVGDESVGFGTFVSSNVMAMRLSGTEGSVNINAITISNDPSRELCISLRYFLGKDETVNAKFLAGSAPNKKLIHSSNLKGKGDVVSEQFSMIIPGPQEQESLQITFETIHNTSFILRSARGCSAKDRDVIIIKAGSECSNQVCVKVNNPTNIPLPLGFGTICRDNHLNREGLARKCYNGAFNYDGWCQCLPGFTGSLCEKACPPGRFGRDCGGKCIDSPDCEGVSLAAARRPFECARGFTGPDCNETCKDGFYGPNCRLECGQCLHGTCDRFTGVCNGPCKRGSHGNNCQDRLATVDRVEIVSTTYDSAEGIVSVTSLSESDLESYPYVQLLYAKMPVPEKLSFETVTPLAWSGKVLSLNSTTVQFKLDSLDYDEKYYVQALLIHKSGDYYNSSWDANPHAVFSTNCNVATFDSVDFVSREESLSLTWKVIDSDLYPCQIRGFQLEIYLPERDSPLRKYMSPHETNTTIDAVLPQDGSFRFGATFETKDTVWTYHVFSNKAHSEVTRNFDIVGKSTRSIDFSWESPDALSQDVVVCEPEQVLCVNRKLETKTQQVTKGQFTMEGLYPFTTYVCTLERSGMQAIAMTQPDRPTGSPKPHVQPVQVTNTTASIQWRNAVCESINGVPKGFRVELWRGNTHEATTTTSDTTFKASFESLRPETSYEAKIYVVNQLGWNAAYFLSIPFKTKSTIPNAVSDLLVYKRTRNDLWLRWLPPDNESNDTVVIRYKVTASAPEVEPQELEIAAVQCPTWPNYFCHRLRSLVPDTEYNIQVQAKNNKANSFGPPTLTTAMTKEGVPDAPVDVRVYNRTATSVVLTWEVPVRLNSNPKFFVVTLEQTDENNSQENPTDPIDSKVSVTEGQLIYEAKFDQLNPATTYVATISAGLRGQRSMLTVNTPPKDPPSPPAPTVDETSGSKRVVFHGIRSKPDFVKLLSGYLLLASTDNTVNLNHGISDPDLAASIQSQLGDNFYVANEFGPSLTDEVFNFETESARPGNFSSIQNMRLEPGHEYRFALAAISTYCGANAVAVSPVLTFKN